MEKTLWEHKLLAGNCFLDQVGLGDLSQAQTLRSVGLLDTEVLRVVRPALKN